jgi:hypothetical protein
MDDLKFKYTIYCDPKCNDVAIKQAAEKDPAKKKFWDELKSIEIKLQKASKVDIPERLANRLILMQNVLVKWHRTL